MIYLALAALLGLALWLRLRFIHTVQLYPDEFVTLLAVKMIGEKGLPVMPSGLFYDHGLLFSYVGSVVAWLGPARWLARYASLLFGLTTLGLTFWLGRRWFSPGVGLIAVTGLAIAPAAIEWSSRARMYALLQLLVLLTLWLAYEGIVQNRTSLRWTALLAYLGATLTHFVAVALAPPLVLGALGVWWHERAGVKSPPLPRSPAPLPPLRHCRRTRLSLQSPGVFSHPLCRAGVRFFSETFSPHPFASSPLRLTPPLPHLAGRGLSHLRGLLARSLGRPAGPARRRVPECVHLRHR